MEYIESKDNKKIKHVRQLQNKKHREQSQEYIAEGFRAVKDMLDSKNIKYILIEENKLFKEEYNYLYQKIIDFQIPCFIIKEGVMHKLDFTESSQGIWAVLHMKNRSFGTETINNISFENNNLFLLLDKIQDPGNLGTIIRTAVAANVKAIFLTKGSTDPYSPKTVRSTMSAIEKIPIYTNLVEEHVLALLQEKKMNTYTLTPSAEKNYNEHSYEGNTLLILGNEGNGVSEYILKASRFPISIPMYGDIESLNLAIAAAIMMYKVVDYKHSS